MSTNITEKLKSCPIKKNAHLRHFTFHNTHQRLQKCSLGLGEGGYSNGLYLSIRRV